MHKTIFFPEKKNVCVPTLPKIFRPVTRNTLILLVGPVHQHSLISLGVPPDETMDPWLATERPLKTLIRL